MLGNLIVKLLLTFLCGIFLHENSWAQSPHVPDEPVDTHLLRSDSVESIDRNYLLKKNKIRDRSGPPGNKVYVAPAQVYEKRNGTDVLAMPVVLPGQNAPICLSPPEIKANLESEFNLNKYGVGIVSYVLEVTEGISGPRKIPLYPSASVTDEPIAELTTDDILRMEETPESYLQKLRAEVGGEPIWRKITVQVDDKKTRDLWFQYSSTTMRTLRLNDQPFEMAVRAPRVKINFPLYREPGFWSPQDCQHDIHVCAALLVSNSRIYLLESQFRLVDRADKKGEWYHIFYHLGSYSPDDGLKHLRGSGWTESTAVSRRTDRGPSCVVISGDLPSDDPEVQAVIEKNEKALFVLGSNSNDPARRKRLINGLGLNPEKMAKMMSIVDITLGSEGHLGFNYISLDQPFAGPEYTQQALKLGGAVYTNLFVDLQLRGSLDGTITLGSNNNSYGQNNLLDAQQLLVYSSPWTLNGIPVKLGVGGYFMSMLSKRAIGGFAGFIGAQGQLLLEGNRWSLGFRYGPIAQDISINLQNRLMGSSLTYKMPWQMQGRPVELSIEGSDVSFSNSATGNSTNMKNIGLQLSFPLNF